jgi:2,3-dihydroxybenzoate-AMP ligase
VVLKRGRGLTLEELVSFLKEREIAKFKLPERLEIVSEFPVSTFGKVSKKALGEMITSKLEGERAA